MKLPLGCWINTFTSQWSCTTIGSLHVHTHDHKHTHTHTHTRPQTTHTHPHTHTGPRPVLCLCDTFINPDTRVHVCLQAHTHTAKCVWLYAFRCVYVCRCSVVGSTEEEEEEEENRSGAEESREKIRYIKLLDRGEEKLFTFHPLVLRPMYSIYSSVYSIYSSMYSSPHSVLWFYVLTLVPSSLCVCVCVCVCLSVSL